MISGSFFHTLAIIAIPLLFAITLHEAAHGWAAMLLGDKTAMMMGRVSLNPAKHIDPIGTVAVPISILFISSLTTGTPFLFGWAKPVPVTWQNLKNPRRDKVLVALAGPGANLFMAILWAATAKISTLFAPSELGQFIFQVSVFGIGINGVLMFLNLIPLPPLDGSRVISSLLPPRIALKYDSIEPYGIWILFALLILGVLGRVLLPLTLSFTNLLAAAFKLPLLY